MISASTRKAVEKTLESIRERTPAYVELTDKFGPLFLLRARLRDDLTKKGIAQPDVDASKLASEIPLFAGLDLSPWTPDFVSVAEEMLPVLADVLELDKTVQDSLKEVFTNPSLVLGLAQARIEGHWKFFEDTSQQLGITPYTTLLFISENVIAPVFASIATTLGESLSSEPWEHGHCPVCGSLPSISHLSPREVTDLDHLVGGGGKKYLHCSLCGHDWRFKRNACAACGNDENDSREVFYVDDVKHERIEACHKCGSYCLSIDMREVEPIPHLDVAQLGLIHLDMYAHKNKLHPIAPTLWNNLE